MTAPADAQVLKKVDRTATGHVAGRLSEYVTQQLLGVLNTGAFPEGAKLPPERELAELLGVSRTVLREALSALQLSGLLVRHPGIGTVIARLPAERDDDDWTKHIAAGASIAELIDARMAVDLGCVHLICAKADRNLTDVAAIVDVMRIEALSRRSIEGYLPPSLEFHVAVARATEAPVLVTLIEDLTERMRDEMWLLRERYTPEIVEKSLRVHEDILATLQAGDLVAALASTKRHYVEYPVLTPAGKSESRA